MNNNSTLEIVALVASVASIIFTVGIGIAAIILAFKFNNLSNKILSRIDSTTDTTQTLFISILQPLLKSITETITAAYNVGGQSQVDSAGEIYLTRTQEQIERILGEQEEDLKDNVRRAINDGFDALTGTLKHNVKRIGQEIESSLVKEGERIIPGDPRYDWTRFIRIISDMEKTYDFLSVKFLREKKFSGDGEIREALQVALDTDILDKYHIPNPNHMERQTLCCRLNRNNQIVATVLDAIGEI